MRPPARVPRRSILALLAVGLLCALSPGSLRAQGEKKPPAADLPPGALFRIGSTRFVHGGEIRALAFSPDGKLLASSSTDWKSAAIRIWDVETGREVLSLKGHKDTVTRLAFLPTGDAKTPPTLVSGGADSTIRFWNARTGDELPQIVNHPGPVGDMAISPDGKKIASGGPEAKHIFIWDAATGKEFKRWEAHEGGVVALCFGPEGRTLASGGGSNRDFPGKPGPKQKRTVALWDVTKGEVIKYFPEHDFQVMGVALSSDGKVLVAGGPLFRMGAPIWWDAATGKELHNARTSCYGITTTADRKSMAASDTSQIRFFDVETGAAQQSLNHPHRNFPRAMAYSPDGDMLATGGEEGRIILWDARRRIRKMPADALAHAVHAVAMSPDGKAVLTVGGDGVLLWERSSGKLLRKLESKEEKRSSAFGCFLPDNRTLAIADVNNGIAYWNWEKGEELRQATFDHPQALLRSITADGTLFLTGGHGSKDMIVWDAATGKVVQKLPAPLNKKNVFLRAALLSPNGEHLLAIGLTDHTVYEVESGKVVQQKAYSGFAPAFSPGGIAMAMWTFNKARAIQLVETATGNELASINLDKGPYAHGERIVFSPDGRSLVLIEAGSRPTDMGAARLFDIATGKLLKTFAGHRGKVTMAAFTPDSKALITGSEDCSALVWDLKGVLPAEKVDAKASWDDMAGPDRRAAYVAFCRLRSAPDDAIAFLKKELAKPAPQAELEALRRSWAIRLLEDLNSATARVLLQELAGNSAEAQAALRRMERGKASQ